MLIDSLDINVSATMSKKSEYQYMMDKFCGQHGGLKPKNLEWELEEGYEIRLVTMFGNKEGFKIVKKK